MPVSMTLERLYQPKPAPMAMAYLGSIPDTTPAARAPSMLPAAIKAGSSKTFHPMRLISRITDLFWLMSSPMTNNSRQSMTVMSVSTFEPTDGGTMPSTPAAIPMTNARRMIRMMDINGHRP